MNNFVELWFKLDLFCVIYGPRDSCAFLRICHLHHWWVLSGITFCIATSIALLWSAEVRWFFCNESAHCKWKFVDIWNEKTKRGSQLGHSPVSKVWGCLPHIMRINSLNTHLNVSAVSSPISTPPKITIWKWMFTPTNSPNGILYKSVRYDVSNVIASPK